MITVTALRNALWCMLAFTIVACATSGITVDPTANARLAIERAEQMRAAEFASVELAGARAKLEAAERAAATGDSRLVVRLAEQAEIDAELAASTSRAKREMQRASEMDEGLRELRDASLRSDDAGARGSADAAPAVPPATL
jgi:hypothetical protein